MQSLKFDNCYYKDFKGTHMYFDHANKRLIILDFSEISGAAINEIINQAEADGLGKIIAYCRIKQLKPFRDNGFTVEGLINGFFKGEDAFCVSYFADPDRSISGYKEQEDYILSKCTKEIINKRNHRPNNLFTVRDASLCDIPEMTALFSEVFETYPSPVFSPEYLQKVMNEKVLYKVAVHEERIVSIAAADMDALNLNAEITDCATYPQYRGKGLLSNLIYSLEDTLKKRGFYTLYSLSRSINESINMALCKHEFRYGGRLVNNCHICGCFEDMNIWVKKLKR